MRFTPGIVAIPQAVASLVFREPNPNLVTNPEAINLWPTLGACVVTANTLNDPEGNLLAETMTDNAIGTTGVVTAQAAPSTLATSTLYRASLYVKAGTAPWMRLSIVGLGALSLAAYFNPSTGAPGNLGANVTASGVDAPIAGWYRVWLTFTSDAADTSCNMQIALASANGTATVLRDGTKTLHAWLAQLALV
jgi:hypothetical protein